MGRIPNLLIKNSYEKNQENLIWEEIDFLDLKNKSHLIKDGVKNVFFHEIYAKSNISNTENLFGNIFNQETKENFSDLTFGYKSISNVNKKVISIGYIDNDIQINNSCLYIMLSFFTKQVKSNYTISLKFEDDIDNIEIENNMTILFPSFIDCYINKSKEEKNEIYYTSTFLYVN